MKILTEQCAITLRRPNPKYSSSDSSTGPEYEEKVVGIEHIGMVGSVQVKVAVMENETMSLTIGNMTLALSPDLLKDLKELLKEEAPVSLAS